MKKSRYGKFRWPMLTLAVIMLLLVSLGQASLATSNAVGDEFTIEMEVPPITLGQVEANGMTFQRLAMQNAGRTGEVGRPELPTFGRYVAVPVGARVQVEILEAQSTIQSDVLVYPAQEPLPECAGASPPADGGAFAFDADFYTQDAMYPGEPVVIGEMGKLRDVTYAIVRFFPAQYNPARRELTLYSYLRVRVSFVGGLQDDTGGRYRAITQDPYLAENYERIYRRLFANYGEVAADIPLADALANGTGADFLIIAAPDLARPAQDLAEWKNRRGIQTVVKTTAETGSSASAIAAYIQNAYDTWSPRPAYVLLLGDAESIPVHYATVHPYSSYGGTRTGTDLYYFTTSGTDYMPDIAGGRIPASTEEEARLVVDNILQYEQDPPTDATFYSNIQVAAYFQDGDSSTASDCVADRLFAQTSEEIRDYLVNNQGKTATRCYTTNSTCTSGDTWRYYGPGSVVPAAVKTALLAHSDHTCVSNDLQQGRFILNHRDHGLWYGWGDPDFYINDVRDLSYATDGELPVVFSINCETGWFDSETDDGACSSNYTPSSSSFAEEWLTYGKAVAVFAATRVSYSWYNDDLVKGYYDGIWSGMLPGFSGGSPFSDNLHRLGDAFGWGKAYFMSQYPDDVVRLTTMEIHHFLGDPTMEIWTDEPQDLTVSHSTTASAGITNLDVNVDVAGATITVVQDGEIIGQVASSVSGNNPVALSPAASAGVLYVTVTKHNYRPYEGGVGVEAVSTISGYITDGGGGVPDVWVDFGPGVPMARTDATGFYAQVVGDGSYTVAPANERWVISPTNQVVVISGLDVSNVDFAAESYRAQTPYLESFESGRLGPEWTVDLDTYGRAGTLDCPNSGDYALILDEVDPNLPATPAAILSVDLAGSTGVTLNFQWREAGDEDHPEDGVYIRRNTSDTWCKIYSLTGGSSAYQQVELNLNALANTCWGSPTLTEDFQIKFQQSDTYPWMPWSTSSDGIAIDDVGVYSLDDFDKRVYLPVVVRNWPAPSGGGDIVNGDFEDGRDGSWSESSTSRSNLIVEESALPISAHGGSWLAWLGGPLGEESTLSQQVVVPASATTLDYSYWISSTDTERGWDWAYVRFGSTSLVTYTLSVLDNTEGWVQGQVDVTSWQGQTVNLRFVATTDIFLYESDFYVDDVSFSTAAPDPPALPEPP